MTDNNVRDINLAPSNVLTYLAILINIVDKCLISSSSSSSSLSYPFLFGTTSDEMRLFL